MADITFNIALGKVAYYASLPAANDALVMVPLEASGLESDAVLKDKNTLADVLAGATNEQTTLGRKTLAAVTVTVDDTNDRVDVDCADVTWVAASGNPVGAVVVCYDPDTTSGTDADLVPLTKHDFPFTPNGTDAVVQVPTTGFYRTS